MKAANFRSGIQKSIVELWLLSIFLLFMSILSLQAQAEAHYRLRTSSGDDYLEFMLTSDVFAPENVLLLETLLDEIQFLDRLTNGVGFEPGLNIYRRLAQHDSILHKFDHSIWVAALVENWINNQAQFPLNSDRVTFEEFTVDVQPIDFLQDGQTEYLLAAYRDMKPANYMSRSFDASFDAFMLAYRDNDGHYRVVITPTGFNIGQMVDWQRDDWQTLRIEDLNADGKLEWVVVGYGTNTGTLGGIPQWRANVLVLTWDGQTFVELSPQLGFSNDGRDSATWEFLNLDNDQALEIVQVKDHINSWDCAYDTRTLLDWDTEQNAYVTTESREIFPETYGCLWTDAESAMWKADYATAIALYERSLSMVNEDNLSSGWTHEQYQYIQMRRVLAYALSGKPEEAANTLRELRAETPVTEGITQLVETMSQSYLVDHDEFTLCTALYNFFAPYYGTGDSYGYNSPIDAYIGLTLVDSEMYIDFAYTPNPAHSGCDIEQFITNRLAAQTFNVSANPVELFELAGIPVRALLQLDLNGDGLDEWLVWPTAEVKPFLLMSDSEQFVISRPDLPVNRDGSRYQLYELPDNSGTALAWLTPAPLPIYTGTCPNPDHNAYLSLWRLREHEPEWFFGAGICEERTWDDLIQDDGRTLYAWVSDALGLGGNLIDAVYSWDSEQQDYVLIQPPPEYWQALETEYMGTTKTDPALVLENAVRRLQSSLWAANVDENILMTLDTALAGDISQTDDALVTRARYYRALVLEYLNHPDEALTEYVSLYETAPDSAWGLLAALHLENIDSP